MNAVRRRGGPGHVKVGLLYPSTYEASLASLAYQSIYYYLGSRDGISVERFVLGEGPPAGLEFGSRLSSMDVIVASVHYELDYANLVRMLLSSGIEVRRSARRSRPLVVVGGPAPAANPMPISEVADLVAVGDVEPLLPQLADAISSDPRSAADALSGRDGFFSAGVERVRLARSLDLPPEFHPVAQIQPLGAEAVWGRSLLVESSRGCSRLCRFCMEGNLYFPRVDRPLDQIRSIIERGLPANGVDRVTFYSLSFFDHPKADSILEVVSGLGAGASLPSLRLDSLDEGRLRAIAGLGQRTLTLAPESGACALRRALGKPWARGDLLRVASLAESAGIRGLKLYYMVGLPGEPADSAAETAREVLELRRATGLRLSVSLTPFMPKPHTPLQWAGMEGEGELERRIRAIESPLRAAGIEVDHYSPRLARVQTAISRGGPEMLCPIEGRARGLPWGRAFAECGMDLGALTAPLGGRGEGPWSVVDAGRPAGALAESERLYWLELGRPRRPRGASSGPSRARRASGRRTPRRPASASRAPPRAPPRRAASRPSHPSRSAPSRPRRAAGPRRGPPPSTPGPREAAPRLSSRARPPRKRPGTARGGGRPSWARGRRPQGSRRATRACRARPPRPPPRAGRPRRPRAPRSYLALALALEISASLLSFSIVSASSGPLSSLTDFMRGNLKA